MAQIAYQSLKKSVRLRPDLLVALVQEIPKDTGNSMFSQWFVVAASHVINTG